MLEISLLCIAGDDISFRGCSHHKIRGCSIIAKPGRIVAGCSDGIHLKGNEHQPLIEECYLRELWMMLFILKSREMLLQRFVTISVQDCSHGQ